MKLIQEATSEVLNEAYDAAFDHNSMGSVLK